MVGKRKPKTIRKQQKKDGHQSVEKRHLTLYQGYFLRLGHSPCPHLPGLLNIRHFVPIIFWNADRTPKRSPPPKGWTPLPRSNNPPSAHPPLRPVGGPPGGTEAQRQQLLARLRALEAAAAASDWFARHEFIGSSLLVVYDAAHPERCARGWPGAP